MKPGFYIQLHKPKKRSQDAQEVQGHPGVHRPLEVSLRLCQGGLVKVHSKPKVLRDSINLFSYDIFKKTAKTYEITIGSVSLRI